jgi:uncharacterized protein YecT (DUF1311 family)
VVSDVEFMKAAARKLVEEIYKALALAMAIKDEIYENNGEIDWIGLDVEARFLDDRLNNAYEELHKIMWVVNERLGRQQEQQD